MLLLLLLLLQFPSVGQLVLEMGPDVSIEGRSVVTFEAAYGASGRLCVSDIGNYWWRWSINFHVYFLKFGMYR